LVLVKFFDFSLNDKATLALRQAGMDAGRQAGRQAGRTERRGGWRREDKEEKRREEVLSRLVLLGWIGRSADHTHSTPHRHVCMYTGTVTRN
jgi:hypothetical protein